MRIRAAEPADAGAIVAVRLDSWQATYGPLLPGYDWEQMRAGADPSRLATAIADGLGVLVGEVEQAVQGYSLFGPCRDDDLTGANEVYAIYAHPSHWSAGLGRALMSATVDALGPARPISLWVLEANARARRFYERAGFAADGTVQPADMPGGVRLPEVRYRLD